MNKTTDDYFIVLIPTRDGKAFIDMVDLLEKVGYALGRETLIVNCDGTTYWDARNNCIEKLRKALRIYGISTVKGTAKILWCDSDLLIDEPLDKLVGYFMDSDKTGIPFAANYKTTFPGGVVNTVMLPTGDGNYKTLTDSELDVLKYGVNRTGMVAGLGFYYGFVPLDYQYHVYPPYKTEDICFYIDNKVEFRLVPIKLLHNKNVMI